MSRMEPSSHVVALEVLLRTRPWLRLLGVALLLAAVVTVLSGLTLVVIGTVATGMLAEEGEAHVGPMIFVLGLALLSFALVYVYPGILLLRSASRIPDSSAEGALAEAAISVELQGRFWRYVGIAALLALTFEGLMLILVVGNLAGWVG